MSDCNPKPRTTLLGLKTCCMSLPTCFNKAQPLSPQAAKQLSQ